MTVTAADITNLYNTSGPPNPVLADNGNANVIVPRISARGSHWAILAYQIDVKERFPGSITTQQAQTVANEINADLARVVAKREAVTELEG